jgi:ABC-type lipoprotein export system ATPase subunit
LRCVLRAATANWECVIGSVGAGAFDGRLKREFVRVRAVGAGLTKSVAAGVQNDGAFSEVGAGMMDTVDRDGSNRPGGAKPLIALRQVSRVYDGGAITALRNIDLQIAEGECVAIVGASGSGKSSLVNMLCGIDYPTSGHVIWEGRPIRSRHEWLQLRRSRIGIVFQEYNLIPTFSAVDNIELALLGRGLSQKHRYTRAGMVLARVGLEHHPHHLVSRLSGGERQRVAIGRAVINEPKLLLADEPTGNLDTASAAKIADLLFELREQIGMTLVLVTHDEAFAARCDRQIRLRDGSIVDDTLQALIAGTIVAKPRI